MTEYFKRIKFTLILPKLTYKYKVPISTFIYNKDMCRKHVQHQNVQNTNTHVVQIQKQHANYKN